ncbi:MAG TPA: homoserine kinase [Gammaproteobacteria bacterium]
MSVYTTLDRHDLSEFLKAYEIGALSDFQGISEGIENTNYFVNTRHNDLPQSFVLTIFESIGFEELPYFLELTAFLSEHNVPCAHPIADRDGEYLQTLKGKPAALVQRLPGRSIVNPSADDCRQVGEVLARLHIAGESFPIYRANPRGLEWKTQTAAAVLTKLPADEQALLTDELEYQRQRQTDALPKGVIHADLFRDNALFTADKLTGIIDLYYACTGAFLYDLAITANDWCHTENGGLNTISLAALLEGYQAHRQIAPFERAHWQTMLRAAALRFWLSRLFDMHFPRSGELTHIKNPEHFKRILLHHVQTPTELVL